MDTASKDHDSPSASPAMAPAVRFRAWREVALCLLLALTSAEFVVRGPVRLYRQGATRTDFSGPYVGARAWVRGLDPYDFRIFSSLWKESGGIPFQPEESVWSRTPYPWTAFVLLAPVSLFSWPAAQVVAILGILVLIVLAILSLFSLAGPEHGQSRLFFVAFALALAPLHTGLRLGNLAVAAVALAIIGVVAALRRRDLLAGLCLGLAICLKPQVAFLLLLYYAWLGRWKLIATTTAIVAAVAAIGILRMQFSGVALLPGYISNNLYFLHDPASVLTPANDMRRFQMINLQLLLYTLVRNEVLANRLAPVIAMVLLLALLGSSRGSRAGRDELLDISVLGLITLLPIYHRFYDAAILLLPLFWALCAARPNQKLHRSAALLLMLVFLFPGAAALKTLQTSGRIPFSWSQHWWWDSLALCHQIWALFLLTMVLIAATYCAPSGNTATSTHPSQ